MTKEKLIKGLKETKIYNISALEKLTGMPERSLHKAIYGIRPLPDKYLEPLIKALKDGRIV